MEHYLESMIVIGTTSQLPKPSAIIDKQCELFKSRHVTGVLLCGQGHFMAVLEGQPLALQSAIKQTIKNEHNLQTIYRSKIPERSYRHWNMHITEQASMTIDGEFSINNILNTVQVSSKKQTAYQIIKDIVAYYYCEYIVSGFNCNDYRLANIA